MPEGDDAGACSRWEGAKRGRASPRRRLRHPVFQSFSFKILVLGLVAGVIPLFSIFISTGWFSQRLLFDLQRSWHDLSVREGQRLENHQHRLIHQQVRQKALDVAQDLNSYLRSHSWQSWDQMLADPEFRAVAVQPVGSVGETFLVAAADRKILLHDQPSYEGQALEEAVRHHGKLAGDHTLKSVRTGILEEFSLTSGPGAAQCHGFLAPIAVRPRGGPELLVGAWVDPREMEALIAQTRAITKSALNVGGALIELRLEQFRLHQFIFLVFLALLAFVASLILSRRLTGQVAALSRGAEAFDRGDLNYRIAQPGEDELGQLASTLNRMAAGLRDNTISRQEWENTFNALPEQVIQVDREGRLRCLNQAAATSLGVAPGEVLGRHWSQINAAGEAWFPAWALEQALTHGARTHTELCTGQGCTFLITVDPARNRRGEITGAVLMAHDISTLENMRKELDQATHFLEQFFAYAPLGILFVNQEGLIVQCNPQICNDLGYLPLDLLNRHYSFLYVHDEERQQVLKELGSRGEVLGRQVQLRHKNGGPLPVRLSIRKLFGKDGRVMGSVALVTNITEEVCLQRQLEQAQKQEAIATLAGGLAHNFNNLLMVIMGLTTLMLGKITSAHPFYADLQDIGRQVRAGRDITRKLLSFRRPTDFESHPWDLNRLVETTSDMFGRTRPELLIQKELAPQIPAVEVDPGQVQQVIMNLLINAWQAMPQGGRIILTTRVIQLTDWLDPDWELTPGQYVCLSVADTGVGMDEQTVSHLFEPFFTTKESGLGSGLGLASARRIMKNHRGAIQVASTPGEGSCFTLFFPASAARPRDLAPPDGQLIPGQGTILVVDDEPILRRVAGKLLEKLGYQVLEAASGEEALQVFDERRRDINLVLLDVIMPGLTGLQTLERLRRLDPQVRILLCSGMSDAGEENLPDGVSFIPKPFPLETLSQKIAAALSH